MWNSVLGYCWQLVKDTCFKICRDILCTQGLLSNVPHWMLLSILSTLGLRFSLIVIYHLCIHGPMQNLAKTCSTQFLFGIPACIIQSRLFTSSKLYSLKSRRNVLGNLLIRCTCSLVPLWKYTPKPNPGIWTKVYLSPEIYLPL